MNSQLDLVEILAALRADLKEATLKILDLEKRVTALEELGPKKDNTQKDTPRQVEVKPTEVREFIQKKIEEYYPNYQVKKGPRSRLSIVHGNKSISIFIRSSRSYSTEFPAGWLSVREDAVDNHDLFILITKFNNIFYPLLVSKQQLKEWCSQKMVTSGSFMIYANQVKEGIWQDNRDGLGYDLSGFFSNWSIIEQLMESN